MPPTSTFRSAASSGISGMGYSRISVLLGPVRTAASTVAATATTSMRTTIGRHCRSAGRPVKPQQSKADDPCYYSEMSALLQFRRSDRQRPEHVAALEQVRAWTRERFALASDDTVLVSEIACGIPGCPPLETLVAFWTKETRRHQFKVFKPVEAVVLDDLPPAWMKEPLAVDEEAGCECC